MSRIICIFSFATEPQRTQRKPFLKVSVFSVALWQNYNLILLRYLPGSSSRPKTSKTSTKLWSDREIWPNLFNQAEKWDELIAEFNDMTGLLKQTRTFSTKHNQCSRVRSVVTFCIFAFYLQNIMQTYFKCIFSLDMHCVIML